jgi:hypothetical protein
MTLPPRVRAEVDPSKLLGGACAKCFAKRLPGEEWTQNGNGWLCGRCYPSPEVHEGYGNGEGNGYVEDTDPLPSPPYPHPHVPADDGVPSFVDWLLEEHAVGRERAQPVALPNSAGLSPAVDKVARFFELVHGLRLAANWQEGEPVPFGCDWVARHLGLSSKGVWKALRILEKRGALRTAGRLPGRGKKGVDTYLPGDGSGS